MRVMPIWTVERKRPGFVASLSARFAPRRPDAGELSTGVPGGDDSQLRQREEAVEEDEAQDDQDLDHVMFGGRVCAPATPFYRRCG